LNKDRIVIVAVNVIFNRLDLFIPEFEDINAYADGNRGL